MDEPLYRFLKWTAILMASGWIAWTIYESFVSTRAPGDTAYLEGENLFEDGEYERALAKYGEALAEAPEHLFALRGRARAKLQLGRLEEALADYDLAITLDPEFAAAYANRGVLHDRMGRYGKAVEDYDKALALDPELAEGPHWLTRFLRLQPDKPPTIADRAAYLRAELVKPDSQRLLRVPELDEQQRSYQQ